MKLIFLPQQTTHAGHVFVCSPAVVQFGGVASDPPLADGGCVVAAAVEHQSFVGLAELVHQLPEQIWGKKQRSHNFFSSLKEVA